MTNAPDHLPDILYHEGPCFVVNKPSGVLTQAVAGVDSMEVRMKDYLRWKENKTGRIYAVVTHRLDRPVSGALIFARHVRAARRICDQFAGRLVGKTYWALVEGDVAESSGTWRDTIRKVPGVARAEVVPTSHAEGRDAVLHFQKSFAAATWTLLQIQLETGRTHQIRVQCAQRGHPLLGDDQYGSTFAFGQPAVDPRARAIGLHARELRFRHPMSRDPVKVVAPLPSVWGAFLPDTPEINRSEMSGPP